MEENNFSLGSVRESWPSPERTKHPEKSWDKSGGVLSRSSKQECIRLDKMCIYSRKFQWRMKQTETRRVFGSCFRVSRSTVNSSYWASSDVGSGSLLPALIQLHYRNALLGSKQTSTSPTQPGLLTPADLLWETFKSLLPKRSPWLVSSHPHPLCPCLPGLQTEAPVSRWLIWWHLSGTSLPWNQTTLTTNLTEWTGPAGMNLSCVWYYSFSAIKMT